MEFILKCPFYTKYAYLYDRIIERPYKSDCDFIERIISEKKTENQFSILDVGCGTGNYSIELAHRGYRVTGVDISKEQISVAQSKVHTEKSDVIFLHADIFNYKPAQTFDLVLCRGVLNDIIDDKLRQNIFKIFKSLLKVDGILVFDVRDWDNSFYAKSNNSVTEKSITVKDGTLLFKSETRFNKALKRLLIKETHIFKSNGSDDIDEFDFIMQCWTVDELKNNLENAMFGEFDFYGDYKFEIKFGETEKIIVVAK